MQVSSDSNEGRLGPNSLTAHLKCKGSPVRQFMESVFGATRKVGGPSNAAVRQLETVDPGHRAYSTVGSAIDRRIRLYFPGAAENEAAGGVTLTGAYELWKLLDWDSGSLHEFFEALKQFTSQIETAQDRLGEPCHLGPTFDGSGCVGGADADMILGTSLIDVKTTVDPKVTRDGLWQILGYALHCSGGVVESWPPTRGTSFDAWLLHSSRRSCVLRPLGSRR